MTKILVTIWAYEHHAKFIVECEDNSASLEKAILDKLGEKSIVWEKTGMFSRLNRITYEEVINDDANAHPGSLQREGNPGPEMEARAS